MDADTEKITTIQLAFASSQCNVDSLRSADSSHEASVVHPHGTEENAVDKDCEIADLKRRLADKSRRLIEAEKKLVLFNTETKRDDTVEDAHETLRQTLDEMKDLKQKVISSTEELNEAQGKLIFLRKVVLSVVPYEEDDEHDDTNCGEAEAKC
jgi:DNA repair exonuclease SbcCD ATPase subunit